MALQPLITTRSVGPSSNSVFCLRRSVAADKTGRPTREGDRELARLVSFGWLTDRRRFGLRNNDELTVPRQPFSDVPYPASSCACRFGEGGVAIDRFRRWFDRRKAVDDAVRSRVKDMVPFR